jgi:hypothetical protein
MSFTANMVRAHLRNWNMSTDRRVLLEQRLKALQALENPLLPRDLRDAAKKALDTSEALLVLQDAEKLQNNAPLPPTGRPDELPDELKAAALGLLRPGQQD